MRDESFGKKLNWDKYSKERESQSLCFDFSDSHLKTCFLQKATLSKRYGASSSPRKQKQKLSALTIGFLKNIYIVIGWEEPLEFWKRSKYELKYSDMHKLFDSFGKFW